MSSYEALANFFIADTDHNVENKNKSLFVCNVHQLTSLSRRRNLKTIRQNKNLFIVFKSGACSRSGQILKYFLGKI